MNVGKRFTLGKMKNELKNGRGGGGFGLRLRARWEGEKRENLWCVGVWNEWNDFSHFDFFVLCFLVDK